MKTKKLFLFSLVLGSIAATNVAFATEKNLSDKDDLVIRTNLQNGAIELQDPETQNWVAAGQLARPDRVAPNVNSPAIADNSEVGKPPANISDSPAHVTNLPQKATIKTPGVGLDKKNLIQIGDRYWRGGYDGPRSGWVYSYKGPTYYYAAPSGCCGDDDSYQNCGTPGSVVIYRSAPYAYRGVTVLSPYRTYRSNQFYYQNYRRW